MPFLNITTVDTPSRSIILTPEEIERFGLQPGSVVTVRVGSAATDVEITGGTNSNYISLETLHALGLPQVPKLNLIKDDESTLRVGPLIGLMISRGKRRKTPPYSSQAELLRSFATYAAATGCISYVFSPAGVDAAGDSITGYYLSPGPNGTTYWAKHTFPLPDVVYDRILFRSYERKKLTKLVTSYLADHKHIHYFNPKFLNKWETYSILYNNPVFHGHLPETMLFDEPENFLKFLEIHNTVYLKPINGSLGKGIIRISRSPENYGYQYRDGKKTVSGIWSDPAEMVAGLKKFMGRVPFIMQKGLDLVKYRDRVFDIRVLLQKNGQGRWTITAMVARVAMAGSIFPNVAAGGVAVNITKLWQELTGQDWFASDTCSRVKELSTAAGETLEQALGIFGEIGLDIGIDAGGTPWIIEINSKPSRKVFPKDQPHLKELSIKQPIDFARYLAGFAKDEEMNLS